MLGATIADIGLGRLDISARRRCDPISSYAIRDPGQNGGPVFFQKFLDDPLGLGIFAFAEVVITDSSFRIDEIIRRPVFVVERIPNLVVAVDGDGVGNLQIPDSAFYVDTLCLEPELRRMYTDCNQPSILIFRDPSSRRETVAGC